MSQLTCHAPVIVYYCTNNNATGPASNLGLGLNNNNNNGQNKSLMSPASRASTMSHSSPHTLTKSVVVPEAVTCQLAAQEAAAKTWADLQHSCFAPLCLRELLARVYVPLGDSVQAQLSPLH